MGPRGQQGLVGNPGPQGTVGQIGPRGPPGNEGKSGITGLKLNDKLCSISYHVFNTKIFSLYNRFYWFTGTARTSGTPRRKHWI